MLSQPKLRQICCGNGHADSIMKMEIKGSRIVNATLRGKKQSQRTNT